MSAVGLDSEERAQQIDRAIEDTKTEWKKDFPMCSNKINAAYDCYHRKLAFGLAGGTQPSSSKMCEPEQLAMEWCFLGSFCKEEYYDLLDCAGGPPTVFPEEIQSKFQVPVPLKCAWKFNRLDRCLTRQTQQPTRRW